MKTVKTSWKTRLTGLAAAFGMAVGAIAVGLAAPPAAAQDDDRSYLLSTAGTGGT